MLKEQLTESWSFFKDNVMAITLLILPISVPIKILVVIFQNSIANDDSFFYKFIIPELIGGLATPIYSVAVVFYIVAIIAGEKIDTKTLWKLGVKFWFPYLIMSILYVLSVVIGFVTLILPGIIFSARFSFAEFDLLLRQSTPIESMKNSWSSTKDYTRLLLGGFAVITGALMGSSILIAVFLAFLYGESSILYKIFHATLDLAYDVFGAVLTIFLFQIYRLSRVPQAVINE